MTIRPATLLAYAVLALAGAAVGVLVGRWSASRGPAERDAVPAERDPPQSTGSLDALRYAIDDLARALRERAPPASASPARAELPASDRQPIASDASAFDRLASAVERLDGLLRTGARGARATAASPIGPGYASLAVMVARIDALRAEHPDELDSLAGQEFSKAHVLWTRDDVIQRYGLPSRTENNGDNGLNLLYEALAAHAEHCFFVFATRMEPGSLVTYVEFYCNG